MFQRIFDLFMTIGTMLAIAAFGCGASMVYHSVGWYAPFIYTALLAVCIGVVASDKLEHAPRWVKRSDYAFNIVMIGLLFGIAEGATNVGLWYYGHFPAHVDLLMAWIIGFADAIYFMLFAVGCYWLMTSSSKQSLVRT